MKSLTRLLAVFVCSLILLPAFSDAEAAGPGQLYRERLEVGRALIEVQSTNLPQILPFYTNDIEYHDAIVDIYGIDAMTEFLFRLFGSTPDLVTTIEDETLFNGVYMCTWTMVGRFLDVPYEAKGISTIKFRSGTAKVYYQRDYYTEGDIMANIPGLDLAIEGFRTVYKCAVDPTFECPFGGDAGDAVPGIEQTLDAPGSNENAGRDPARFELRRQRLEIGRALIEVNSQTWPLILSDLTPDYEYHDPIVDIYGPDIMAEFLGRLFSYGGPELITLVEDETLLNGVYMCTWTMTGLLDGALFSAPGMSIVKFRPGEAQSYYSRDYYTEGDIMATIPGLDQAVEGFRTVYKCAVDPTFECPIEQPAVFTGFELTPDKSDFPQPATALSLRQNSPNPFNPSTEISFVVPDGGANVSLRVYDVAGRLVRTLVDGFEPAGTRAVSWHGKNAQGRSVASGVYYYQLTGPAFSEKKKMVLLK